MGKVIGWIVALALVVSAAIGGMYLYSRSNGGFAYEEPAYDAATLPHIAAGQTLAFTDGQNRSALLGGGRFQSQEAFGPMVTPFISALSLAVGLIRPACRRLLY